MNKNGGGKCHEEENVHGAIRDGNDVWAPTAHWSSFDKLRYNLAKIAGDTHSMKYVFILLNFES